MSRDPRSLITPDAFTVAPDLLGIALARPSRRLAAIAVDALLAALLAKSGFVLFAAIVLALGVWRALAGPVERMVQGRARLVFRAATVVLAVVVFVNAWSAIADSVRGLGEGERERAGANVAVLDGGVGEVVEELNLSTSQQAELVGHVARLQLSDSAASVERASSLAQWVVQHTAEGERRTQLVDALTPIVPPSGLYAFQASLGQPAPAPADTVAQLLAVNARLQRVNRELEEDLRQARESGASAGSVLRYLRGMLDDLGVGFSWFALYFTAFTVLGRGQTPGKWLLGIKVIRLDRRPLGWWLAFERFGGYAASASTGLLGFAQILWDRNRQGLHDKATETVVIRVRKGEPVRIG